MAKVVVGSTMSLDGYMSGPNGDLSALYPDLDVLRDSEMLKESIRNTGAAVMGRRAYDMAQGDLTGYEYQVPIFVLTHHPPERPSKGENDRLKVHFVTDGIEKAIRRAKEAAGERDVQIIGGASAFRQCLTAGLADEIIIGIMPVLLGGGLRLFEGLHLGQLGLEKIRVYESGDGRTDILYRMVKGRKA